MTCIAIAGAGMTVLFGLGMKPESIPPAAFTHGFAKSDSVTVWLALMNSNWTMSPMAALIVSGT